MYYCRAILKISPKSVKKFLSNVANRQTNTETNASNRQTNTETSASKNITLPWLSNYTFVIGESEPKTEQLSYVSVEKCQYK